MENLGDLHGPLGLGKHFYGVAAVKLYSATAVKFLHKSFTAGGMASKVSYCNNKVLGC